MSGVFVWTDDLSVGIEEIDQQHQMLVNILNELFHAVAERKSEEMIGETLDALIGYTLTHFELEEKLLQSANYAEDEFTAHKAAHRVFVSKIEGIARKSVVENKVVAFELINFLKHWLREHISITDKKYAEALRQSGYSTQRWEQEARREVQARKRPWWKFWG